MVLKFRTGNIIVSIAIITLICLMFSHSGAVPTAALPARTIVIDAGHGAPDGGAVGKSGVLESDINLAVSLFLQKELENRGYAVIMTRSDENGIYKKDDDSIRNKKRSDLNERAKIVNESGADLLISVHMNFFGVSKYSGPQVFYKAGSEDGKRGAQCMKQSFEQNIGAHCTREIKPVTDGIFLLREAKIASVLVECGFLSNEDEEKLLISEEYQKKLAYAIACAADMYFSTPQS